MIEKHITKYDVMPIPVVEEVTQYFVAGNICIGVEYRLLDDEIIAANPLQQAEGQAGSTEGEFVDRGVSLHVFANTASDKSEYLRFDCFQDDPHYHYVCWARKTNEIAHIDTIADGDPLAWALERIRTRLPQMLIRAGAAELARQLDLRLLEDVLPQVAQSAYHARYCHDENQIRQSATRGRTDAIHWRKNHGRGKTAQ